MKTWKVNYYADRSDYQPVREWIDGLNVKLQVKIFRSFALLEEFNIMLREPYVKPLGEKLYKLRVKDHKGIYRIIYFSHIERQFIMLHGFVKKTDKTPKKEIMLAKKRENDGGFGS